jgi:hypothetical protein
MTTDTLTRTESFECGGPVELDVRLKTGRIEVRAAETSTVRVQLAPDTEGARAAAADVLRETRVELEDGKLVVRGPRGFAGCGLSVTIEAPRRSSLKAHAHHASIAASGALAGLVAATGRGAVTADEVDGPADVATGSGAVRLGRVAGPLRARVGSGSVHLGSLEGQRVRIATGNGDLHLGIVEGHAQLRTGRGGITVGEAGGGELTLVSGAGDLRVGLRPGVAAELDLASGSWEAGSELDLSEDPPAGAPAARIRMRTGSGKAVVARAAG